MNADRGPPDPAGRFRAFARAQPSDADARAALRTLGDLLRFAVSRFEAAGLLRHGEQLLVSVGGHRG